MDAGQIEARKTRARAWFERLRDDICVAFERLEDEAPASLYPGAAARFVRTPWQRADHSGVPGGGGVMSMMHGRLFEKVGVHCSTVHGEFAPEFRTQIPGAADDPRFWASGVSLIAHLANPHVPAVHLNTRFVVTTKAWFGGGADLTPMTPDDTDTETFHAALKAACDRHDPGYYPRYKAWCDEYFFLPHRGETRGVGGVFFDYLGAKGEHPAEQVFDFVCDLGRSFVQAYVPIAQRRQTEPYGDLERAWQLRRRGRYVEFNLVFDRGTLFGLQSGGRTESILMSMPPIVKWRYDWKPEPGTPEARLYTDFLVAKDWLGRGTAA
jgi:coproporphyrinogen III oxidase